MRLLDSLTLTALGAASWTAAAVDAPPGFLPVTAQDMTYTASKVYAGAAAKVQVPAAMFSSDEPDSDLTITITAMTDAAGFDLSEAEDLPLVDASPSDEDYHIMASTVAGGPAMLKFKVTAADPDDNEASAVLTVPVLAKPRPVLTVADNRQVFTSEKLLFNNNKQFSVVATYPEPMTGFASAGASYGLSFSGTNFTSCAPAAPTSSNKGRVWTWAVTCAEAFDGDTGAVSLQNNANEDGSYTIKRAGDNAPSDKSNTVDLEYDSAAPAATNFASANSDATMRQLKFVAVQGASFFAPVPVELFDSAADVTITGGVASTSLGLRLVPGANGLAYITGTATAAPVTPAAGCPNNGIFFTVTGADKAGNTATAKLCVQILPRSTLAGYTSSFAVSNNATFTEGGSAFAPFTALNWGDSNSGTNSSVEFTALTGDEGFAAGFNVFLDTPDALAGANSTKETIKNGSNDTAPEQDDVDRRAVANIVLDDAADLAAVNTLLGGIMYSNDKESFTPGARMLHIQLVGTVGNTTNIVLAAASRPFTATNVNDAPETTGLTITTTAFDTADDTSLVVLAASSEELTDADDTHMTKAELVIAKDNLGTGAGACDSARDLLELPTDYVDVEETEEFEAPPLYGAWDASACTLTLKPLDGKAAVTKADMLAALKAVVYRNLDLKNPLNGRNTDADNVLLNRTITFKVTDAASAGKTSATASSEVVDGELTITHADLAPEADWAKIYGPGGLFMSQLDFSNVKEDYAPVEGGAQFNVAKYPLAYTKEEGAGNNTAANASLELTFDLSKAANGVWAGGAIFDRDTKDMVNITAACAGCEAASVTFAWAEDEDNEGMYTASFSIAEGDAPTKGELPVVVTFTTAEDSDIAVTFFVDVRVRACQFPAENFDADEQYPDGDSCDEADFTTPVNVTATTTINVAKGSAPTLPAFGEDYTLDAKVKAAESVRRASRGAFALAIPPAAVSAMAALPLVAQPVPSTLAALLPAPAKEGSSIDAGAAIKLGPACTTFAEPIEICVYVGNTASDATRTLMLASQKDCADATQGYKELEPALDVTFDPISGKLCGKTTHFTVAAPVLVPVVPDATVAKVYQLGGSCPNDCSGHGYCRQEGKCVCFSGYQGYDCSQRACPAEQSWDWDSANAVVHKPVECSNRGACDSATGTCACYEGFEGPACQRVKCPSDCSGHGRCRLLKELPLVQQAGYSSWELDRVQVCRCDGGWTGLDCSQRLCPYGDDPETVCRHEDRQVQRVKLSFGTIPSDVTPTGTAAQRAADAVRAEDDEFAVVFRHVENSNFSTPTIGSIFRNPTAGADNFEAALKSLPSFAVSDVTVSGAFDSSDYSVSYDVTFTGSSLQFALTSDANVRSSAAANTVTGKQELMVCPLNRKGVMGCTAAGCRPLFSQLRMFSQSTGGSDISLNANAILEQPEELNPGNKDTANVWGVTVAITVTDDVNSGIQYFSATSQVYGQTSGTPNAETLAAKPMPPAGLRKAVPVLYGLLVDMDDTVQAGTYTFNWRLPSCAVTEATPASPDYELAECSRRGVCDRKTGTCSCFQGYYGYNCGQQTIMF